MERARTQRSRTRSEGSSCPTPELSLDRSFHLDDESVGTPAGTPATVHDETEGESAYFAPPMTYPSEEWDALVQDIDLLFDDERPSLPPAKDLADLPPVASLSWRSNALSLPGTPDTSMTPAWAHIPTLPKPTTLTKRALDEASGPCKKWRADEGAGPSTFTIPAYTPPALPNVIPRALPSNPDTSTVRAWLVERQAVLQKTHRDLVRDAARLEADQAAWSSIETRLADHVAYLRRTHPTVASSSETWTSSEQIPDLAALLEQDILYL